MYGNHLPGLEDQVSQFGVRKPSRGGSANAVQVVA